jgi:hypothetical protein
LSRALSAVSAPVQHSSSSLFTAAAALYLFTLLCRLTPTCRCSSNPSRMLSLAFPLNSPALCTTCRRKCVSRSSDHRGSNAAAAGAASLARVHRPSLPHPPPKKKLSIGAQRFAFIPLLGSLIVCRSKNRHAPHKCLQALALVSTSCSPAPPQHPACRRRSRWQQPLRPQHLAPQLRAPDTGCKKYIRVGRSQAAAKRDMS